MNFFVLVKRDFEASDEEGIKMKEQAILNLGKLLSKHGKAEGIRLKEIYNSNEFIKLMYLKCRLKEFQCN